MDEATAQLSKASYSILSTLIIAGLVIGFLILIILSLIVRDTKFISENRGKFMTELFLMSVLASLPVFYIGYSRNLSMTSTVKDFLLLVCKFGLAHICLQLSGFYTNLFSA